MDLCDLLPLTPGEVHPNFARSPRSTESPPLPTSDEGRGGGVEEGGGLKEGAGPESPLFRLLSSVPFRIGAIIDGEEW